MAIRHLVTLLTASLALTHFGNASPLATEESTSTCKKTKVAVLGAGCAGIFAAQALHNASVDDFLIVEYNDEIGGRVRHTTFGQKPGGKGNYTIELGANWVQGLVSKGGPENPIWTLAKKWKVKNKYSNYSSILTYDENGANDYSSLFDVFEDKYATYEQNAGTILTQNYQDRSQRVGFSLAGWKPRKNASMQAVEWFEMDFEYAQTPEQSSQVFSVVNFNTSFYQYSDENNFVIDQRGYNTFIREEAYTFLKKNDPRLLFNHIVTDITYSDTSVKIATKNGGCIEADYAINTFSVGVLQSDTVAFHPALPQWKQTGIYSMDMATYTKIFLQFPPDKVFWDKNVQFFLYADPVERGYYPIFQSLDTPGFLPGSGIFFVTVVQDQSYQVEQQDDEITKEQIMQVLYRMYGKQNVPDPIAFHYPRWSTEPWAFGSYSNWPPGYTLEMHENLRANLGRMWFAGEATSPEYYGFLQGAYFEGRNAGRRIADCIHGNKTSCNSEANYPTLHGSSPYSEYDSANGWTTSPFLTYGF